MRGSRGKGAKVGMSDGVRGAWMVVVVMVVVVMVMISCMGWVSKGKEKQGTGENLL
jgi:uncharacterized membrane protein